MDWVTGSGRTKDFGGCLDERRRGRVLWEDSKGDENPDRPLLSIGLRFLRFRY